MFVAVVSAMVEIKGGMQRLDKPLRLGLNWPRLGIGEASQVWYSKVEGMRRPYRTCETPMFDVWYAKILFVSCTVAVNVRGVLVKAVTNLHNVVYSLLAKIGKSATNLHNVVHFLLAKISMEGCGSVRVSILVIGVLR